MCASRNTNFTWYASNAVNIGTTVELTEDDFQGVEDTLRDYALYSKYCITKLYIPERITHLGIGAFFGCNNVQDFSIPRNLVSIGTNCFYDFGTSPTQGGASDLGEFYLGATVNSIGSFAFRYAKFSSFDTDDLPLDVRLGSSIFEDSLWWKGLSFGAVLIRQNTILCAFKSDSNNPITQELYSIPDSVLRIATYALNISNVPSEADQRPTSLVIPDSVQAIDNGPGTYGVVKLTVGSNVASIGKSLAPSSTTNVFVFRQPEAMEVSLPTPGENTGMVYQKSSRAVDVYTDNLAIRAYGWAADNATVTFHPLSEAPT